MLSTRHFLGLDPRVIRGPLNRNPFSTTRYLDSSHPQASDSDRTGINRKYPLATLNRALAVAEAGDRIILGAGHSETVDEIVGIGTTKHDLQIVGQVDGAKRPIITIGSTLTTAKIQCAGKGVLFENIHFLAGIDALTVMLDIDQSDCTLRNLLFTDTATEQAVTAIDLGTFADGARLEGVCARQLNAGATQFLLSAAVDRLVVANCDIRGDYSTSAVQNAVAAANVLIAHNRISNLSAGDPCINLHASTSGFIADNRLRLATDGGSNWIVAAGCQWYENYGVNDAGERGKLIGTPSA